MSVGNYGAVKNQLDGFVGVDLGDIQGSTLGARSNQGIAILPQLVGIVLTRPDFVNTLNAKISAPTVNTSSGVDVSATAIGQLVAVAWDNSQSATDAYIVVFGVVKASVTLGTTNPSLVIYAKANSQGALVLPAAYTLTNTGLSWDSTTNIYAGATRSTAATVKVMVVYTA
jgi:hypothetical protein